MLPVALVLLVLAAPDDSPARPGEWGFRPIAERPSRVDPPAFVWRPQRGAATYDLEVARDSAFREVVLRAHGLPAARHAPDRPLGEGTFRWRYRFTTGAGEVSAWSRVRRFEIAPGAAFLPRPGRGEVRARIPGAHPRLFLRPGDLPRLRALAKTERKEAWKAVLARCAKLLEKPVDVSEPLPYQPDEVRGRNDDAWRKRWWGNRVRTIEVVDGAATLAFAWMIGGDERHAKEARRLLLAACDWDPNGPTSYRVNDEAAMPFVWAGARAYDWLHGYLTGSEREKVRRVLAVRMEHIHRYLSRRDHVWRPRNSHANRAWHWMGEAAIALFGEVAAAEDALDYALDVFWCAYPVWSDEEGGWHEGLAYFTSYVGRVTAWLAVMRAATGIDGYLKPFFAKAGDFPLYVSPPGETMGGFGDLTLGFSARRLRPLMSVLAAETGNPYWRWYVEQAGGPVRQGGYLGFLLPVTRAVEAKPPDDLPPGKLFPGVGVAVLHRDLADRSRDVQLMLKSSPMGSQSHGYEAQNSILLSVAGEPILVRSGRRDLYGSPHHRNWMWETKSVSSILVNGRGQAKHSGRPGGEITRFSTGREFDYVTGEAASAYEGRLERFTRSILFLKPDAILVFDVLRAPSPATFTLCFHSPFELGTGGASVRVRGERGGADLSFLLPRGLEIEKTDRFDPPPQAWVKLRQWHLFATTPEPAEDARFVTLIRPCASGGPGAARAARALRSAGALGAEVEVADGIAHVVLRTEGEGPVRLGRIVTDAEIACVVVDERGREVRRFRHGGTAVRLAPR